MRLHAANGDRAGALLVYTDCEAHLQRELGLAPDVTTQQLRAELLGSAVEQEPHPLRRHVAP